MTIPLIRPPTAPSELLARIVLKVRRLYIRTVLWPVTTPLPDPEWSTETAVCAVGCSVPIVLGEQHRGLVLTSERQTVDGGAEPSDPDSDGDDLAYAHLACWPGDEVVIAATLGEPGRSTVRSAVTS